MPQDHTHLFNSISVPLPSIWDLKEAGVVKCDFRAKQQNKHRVGLQFLPENSSGMCNEFNRKKTKNTSSG